MAVDRVEKLLRKVTEALNHAGIDYAIIGGNAVSAWIARVDEAAARRERHFRDRITAQAEACGSVQKNRSV